MRFLNDKNDSLAAPAIRLGKVDTTDQPAGEDPKGYDDRLWNTTVRTDTLWIALFIFAASMTVSALVPRMAGYIIVLGVYALFVSVLVATDRFAIVYHRAVLIPILLIWGVFALTTALAPSMAGVLRLGAFTVITGINLFVVPAVIDQSALHEVIGHIAGLFVLIGLPTVLIGSYGIAGFPLSLAGNTRELFGVMIYSPTSVFDNQNYLSGFAAMGAIAAGARYRGSNARAPLVAGLVGLNVLGVVFAGGRAALLALIVAAMLYAVYRIFGRTAMVVLVGLGVLIAVVGFAMAFRLVPGPSIIANVDLSNRRALWTAVYEATVARPVVGWGPGNDIAVLAEYVEGSVKTTHNSYLRMFLISGVLGGGAYLVISVSIVVIGLRNVSFETVCTLLLLIAFLVLQLFAGMTIFGLSLLSLLGALFVGYIQSSGRSRRVEFNVRQLLTDSDQESVVR